MRINEIAPPGREKQVKKLKKKFDDPGAPYAIAWAQHNKHGKPKKKESINFNSERDEVKAILDKHNAKSIDDIDYGSAVYQELYNYFANSGEMPYGVMKARDGDPDQWIADRLDDLGLVEIADVPTQKGRDAKPNVLTPRAMNVVKKQIKKDANKQRRADSKKAVDVEEAPFGAVKKAMNTVKRAVGSVPGMGNMKQQAQGERDIGNRANAVWQQFNKFLATDPDTQQQQAWFKKFGLDVVADGPNDKIDQNDVFQAIKTAKGAEDSGIAKADTTEPDEMDKATLVQLQKIAPNADAKTMRAVNTMAQGKTISGDLQKSLQPVIQKIAVALQNPTQRQRMAKSLGESLSQSDLSKLDMLAREGMVPKNKVARFKTAMRTLAKGKDLPISYKDDVIDVVTKLAKIITKPSVMGMVRKGLKENTDPKEMFDTWVEQHNKN